MAQNKNIETAPAETEELAAELYLMTGLLIDNKRVADLIADAIGLYVALADKHCDVMHVGAITRAACLDDPERLLDMNRLGEHAVAFYLIHGR